MQYNTQERYRKALKQFLDSKKSLENFCNEDLKNKKQIQKLKSGFKLFNSDKNLIEILNIKEKYKDKYAKQPEEQFKLRKAECAINRLKNERLKIAYRLQIISGLRISELANLERKDIIFKKGRLYINVVNGKYNKDRIVKCLPDKFVLDKLIGLDNRENGKLFYNKQYMIDEAREINFHPHDLRKTFAQIFYYNNPVSVEESKDQLREQLGHVKNSNTYLKYINRDINLVNTRFHGKKNLKKLLDFYD
jgi:integrase